MTTGVQYSEEYTRLDSDVGKTDVASGWRLSRLMQPDINWPASVWDQILSLKTCDAEHGSRFLYRSIETDLLAHIMMRVSGLPLHKLSVKNYGSQWVQKKMVISLSMRVDMGWQVVVLMAALRDFGRFGQLYLDYGKCRDKQIIPQDWITDIRRGEHGLWSEERRKLLPNGCYRNQFWIEDETKDHLCV